MSNEQKDSFAALFAQQAAPARTRNLRVGERVEAVVARVGKEAVFVEVDGKRQAWMELNELRAADGSVSIKVGDKLAAQVVEVDPRTGDVRLGRSLGKMNNLAALETARAAGIAVEGKVTAVNKGGLEVELDGGIRGFMPSSQVDNKFVQDLNAYLGRSLQVLVTDLREGGRNIVLSRRALLEREAREAVARLRATLVPGATVRGTVSSVRDFGAFVDLGGVEGLIPASEISFDRSLAVSDRLKAGDVVDVQVREVKDTTSRTGEPALKLTLSLKALMDDPWQALDGVLAEGRVASGTVTRTAEFGVFVKLVAGVEGLLHISELPSKEKLESAYPPGLGIAVVVKKIDREGRKISLALAPEGLAAGTVVPTVRLAVGTTVNAVVEKIEPYGVFVQVEGINGRAGRGLIPAVETGLPRGTELRKALPEGTKLRARVLETGDGRLKLSVRAAKEAEERAEFDSFRDKSVPRKLGTFADLLGKKLGK